jgi:GT2 family glycosyltransferase/glycosyltransferase involved in cell wall biosynthesis
MRQRIRLAPLFVSMSVADRLARPRPVHRTRALPQRWRPGVSVVIPDRDSPAMLMEALDSLHVALARIDEPSQLVVVINGASLGDYRQVLSKYPGVEVVHSLRPLGFSAAICKGMRRARYEWTLLMNNDMKLAPTALRELCTERASDVFAISSQIFQRSADGRREETGFTDWYIDASGVSIFHADPGSNRDVREHLCASGGAGLFRTLPLKRYARASRCYDPFYWEDVEWSVRARQDGLRVLFCPRSHVWHRHRATTARFYALPEIDRIVERNRILFDARNAVTDRRAEWLMTRVCDLGYESQRALARFPIAARVLCRRYAALRRPHAAAPPILPRPQRHVVGLTSSYSFHLRDSVTAPSSRPRLLVVTPFCIFPPRHGGARRVEAMLRVLRSDFDIVLVTDEASLYDARSLTYFDGLHAARFVQRPREERPRADSDLRHRIWTHCHGVLADAVRDAIARYHPDLVQIEHVELAELSRHRKPGQRWLLALHDAFDAADFRTPDAASRLQEHLRRSFDAVTVCSLEDQGLVDHPRAVFIPNGAWIPSRYVPSRGARLLFTGPFRYSQNFEGIREFLRSAYPSIKARVPEASLLILGGEGADARVRGDPVFGQPGVTVLGPRDDVDELLSHSAVCLNPLSGIRGSSIKLIESLAAGRVCVSTEDGARGFLDTDLPGLLVVRHAGDMAEPIIEFLCDEPRRHRLEKPDAMMLDRYSWNRSAESLRNLYRDLQRGTGA